MFYDYLFNRKAIELAKDDIKQLYSCLMNYISYPKEFCSNTMINKIIQKLTNIKNNRIDQVLGKYYLKRGNVSYYFLLVNL